MLKNPNLLREKVFRDGTDQTLLEFIFSRIEKLSFGEREWFEFARKIIELDPFFYIEKEIGLERNTYIFFHILEHLFFLNSLHPDECKEERRLLIYLVLCGKDYSLYMKHPPYSTYMEESVVFTENIFETGIEEIVKKLFILDKIWIPRILLPSEIWWEKVLDDIFYKKYSHLADFPRKFIIERICKYAIDGLF